MRESARQAAQRWIDQAHYDLRAARDLLPGRHYNVACFLAQQAAEKAVKGYLIAQGAEDPWGHSVAALLEDAATFNSRFASCVDTGKWLDKLYVPTRYPNGLPSGIPATAYTPTEAENALAWAEKILDVVGECLR